MTRLKDAALAAAIGVLMALAAMSWALEDHYETLKSSQPVGGAINGERYATKHDRDIEQINEPGRHQARSSPTQRATNRTSVTARKDGHLMVSWWSGV